MSEKRRVVTPIGKLCFDRNLFDKNEKGKITASMVIDNGQDLTDIKALMMEEAVGRWGESLPSNLHWGVKPEDASKFEQYPFLKGCNLLSANSGYPENTPIATTTNQALFRDDIKAGDSVRFSVTAYAYDANGNKGVGLNLGGILLVKGCAKEEAFFQKADVNSMFGSVMTSYDNQAVDNFASSQQPQEAPAQDMSSMNF